ncbi:hypothetical protein ACH45F_40570 [Catenuloplanes sp. NPDC020197]|uniref:Uncharacterized protein n=1 Tax=Catenuloplanes niger TaxID=587534 RepID=A0AAE4CS39_9ACTN|nr:hypothetical protein [Catenuloplanes niger]MDR7320758.1 hypothetical protein [Catenuloplanes niger]
MLAEDVADVTRFAAEVRTALDGGSTEAISKRFRAIAAAAEDEDTYDNSFEALSAVTCTDARHPAGARLPGRSGPGRPAGAALRAALGLERAAVRHRRLDRARRGRLHRAVQPENRRPGPGGRSWTR